MTIPKTLRIAALLLLPAAALPAAAQAAATAPAWTIASTATPTNFALGDTEDVYRLTIINSGGAIADASTEPITVTDTLPPGLEATAISALNQGLGTGSTACTLATLTCSFSGSDGSVEPGRLVTVYVTVSVPSGFHQGSVTNTGTVSGGGAPAASTTEDTLISASPAGFGVQSFAFSTPEADGSPARQAGGHPYATTTTFFLNTVRVGGGARSLRPAQNVKDVAVELPPGLVGNPGATPKCEPADFAAARCPPGSQVGEATIFTAAGGNNATELAGSYFQVPVYSTVPQDGSPAEFKFKILTATQLLRAHVRSDGDYGITVESADVYEGVAWVIGASVTFWGVPADPSHDPVRGLECLTDNNCHGGGPPPTDLALKPFLRSPTRCGLPETTSLSADSWRSAGVFGPPSLSISPSAVGCNQLPFKPRIEARPTTNLADSPSGLDFDLHIPQDFAHPAARETADLRDATVTLPAGIAVNPSSADGLAACTPSQIGLTTPIGQAPIHFTAAPAACPDAAKIGSVEVDSPLLDHPLPGAVYVAEPYANPFGTLLAIYIAVYDPQSGVVVKLPGKVSPNPVTGQLTTSFEENPQLPFEDFKLHFFGGPRAALKTPATCGTFTTNSDLTPWSSPEGANATPSDHFEVTSGPGGACAGTEAEEPNRPRFEAATLYPIAGSYSPFLLHLRREDGSQVFKSLNITLPPGMVGRLAGIPYCLDADLAAAELKTGVTEREAPSCPTASQVGTVTVGAGAGPLPFYVQGKVFLAGPYKGAPLSLAIVTPATAGPYDLGTVVVRTALNVDPTTAQITAKTDPIPSILQGVPLDIRSIAVKMDRPNFTLNPTNCEAMSVVGTAVSTLGQAAPLSNRFQVGACRALDFEPTLYTRLFGATHRGAHPRFRAVLKMKGGEANISRAAVTLPHSEFLDQAHIKTVCTRVQFAEGQVPGEKCPPGSIYGHARAVTPLLDRPLEGPVYLRSSSHKLPDLVAALNGQIDVALDGRIDSVHGGIRNIFEAVPDAPVSKFILTMKGGSKGLLVNSTNICKGDNGVVAKFTGQNGATHDIDPSLKASCGKQGKQTRQNRHHKRTSLKRPRGAG
jgi:hypothetical protein